MDSTSYCQQLATPPGSNLYYALLFHEPAAKKKLLALFSLQLELHRTIVDCQDPGVARIGVFIGISKYRDPQIRPLTTADDDARAIAQALQSRVEHPAIG